MADNIRIEFREKPEYVRESKVVARLIKSKTSAEANREIWRNGLKYMRYRTELEEKWVKDTVGHGISMDAIKQAVRLLNYKLECYKCKRDYRRLQETK
jgi:hypothetical protein